MGSKTAADAITAQVRRKYVLRLRQLGFTYAEIRDKTEQHFGADALPKSWSERYAWDDVKAELDRLRKETLEEAAELRDITLQRYDAMLASLEGKLTAGDPRAIDTALKIEADRRKLLGLDAPTKTNLDISLDANIRSSIDSEQYTRALESFVDALRSLLPEAGN